MSLELLQKISNNYTMAVIMHRELADVFWFAYLPGYALLNEYQMIAESMEQRSLKRYATSTYHGYIPDIIPESADIAAPLIQGKMRKVDIKSDKNVDKSKEACELVKACFFAHRDWEEKSLRKYQQISTELLDNGEVSAFNYVGNIIKDVKAELLYVNDKIIELSSMNWDMPQIIGEQADYYERYSHLIYNYFRKDEEMSNLHHWNSSLEPETRIQKSFV